MLIETTLKLTQEPFRLVIPRRLLWGSQPQDHYCHSSRREISRRLAQSGIEFLKENPPIVFAQEQHSLTRLVIYDGHHRTRLAPKFGIHDIPCTVYTLQQLYENNKQLYPNDFKCSLTDFIESLNRRVIWTLESFRHLPDNKQPLCFNGRISDLTGLPGF